MQPSEWFNLVWSLLCTGLAVYYYIRYEKLSYWTKALSISINHIADGKAEAIRKDSKVVIQSICSCY